MCSQGGRSAQPLSEARARTGDVVGTVGGSAPCSLRALASRAVAAGSAYG